MLLFMGKGGNSVPAFGRYLRHLSQLTGQKRTCPQNRVKNTAHQRLEEAVQIHRQPSETGPDPNSSPHSSQHSVDDVEIGSRSSLSTLCWMIKRYYEGSLISFAC